MDDTQPLILIAPERPDWAEDNALPPDSDNLFQRLIRNPHIESSNPRERECTEMLCAVLRNASKLRLHLFRWLASIAKMPEVVLDNLEFVIDTEQSIGSKRDDLRIEGWRSDGNGQKLVLLWTVEVKVGANFHESSFVDGTEAQDEEPSDRESIILDALEPEEQSLVHQLVNYDHWLAQQRIEYSAGFVMAIQDMTADLPPSLKCPWKCLTWTDLGLQVKAALDGENLPAEESLLARHMLGFLRKHLWSSIQMADERLEFDDIAFLRAFSRMGFDVEKKVNRLVAQLVAVLDESGVGRTKVNHQEVLFRGNIRSMAYRQLFETSLSKYPYLFMGINEDGMALWLETTPGSETKSLTVQAIKSVHGKLLNPQWQIHPIDKWPSKDLELRVPLSILLNVPDQNAAFVEFFSSALADLKQAGVVEAIEQGLRG